MILKASQNLVSQICHPSRQSVRLFAYLHSGSRVRGLKRDPSSYLKNPKGLSYTELKPAEYQEKVKEILQFDRYGIDLPNGVILQCLTHKSFAHGSKPYNEKLSLLGSQFLKYQASIHSLRQRNLLSPIAEGKLQQNINGLNFTNLGTQLAKLLISKSATASFIKAKSLDSLVFWKMKDPLKDTYHNGETTIYSSVLNAIVGGILMINGPEKTVKFIHDFLLNTEKEVSLVQIASEQFKASTAAH